MGSRDAAPVPSPGTWTTRTLGDLCTLVNGLQFGPEDWGDAGLPIIRIQNLNGSADYNHSTRHVADRFLAESGDLLFSWSGNRGTSFGPYVWKGPLGIVNQHIFKVTPKADVDSAWLFRALDDVRRRAEADAHGGSGLVHVKRATLLSYPVSLPPIGEQRRIAEILDTVDETIRSTERLIGKLEHTKQGLLDELLTLGIDDSGRVRDPASQPGAFQEGGLGSLPRDWDEVDTGALLTSPPKNGYSPHEVDEPTGIVMLGLGCLTPTGFLPRQLKNAPRNDPALAAALLNDGDLLISRSNTRAMVGLVGRYRDVGVPATYPDLMMRLAPSKRVLSSYLELALRAPRSRRQIQAAASGTSGSMVKITAATVMSLVVPLPPLEEQGKIVRSFAASTAALNTELEGLNKLRLLKAGLMDDLLTGRVRVNVAETVA